MSEHFPKTPWAPLCLGVLRYLSEMSPAEVKVYLALVLRKNQKTGRLDPSVPVIAADAGLHEDVVTKAITKLEEKGLVIRLGSKFSRYYDLPDLELRSLKSSLTTRMCSREEDESSGRLPDESSASLPDDSSALTIAFKQKPLNNSQIGPAAPMLLSTGSTSTGVDWDNSSRTHRILESSKPMAHKPLARAQSDSRPNNHSGGRVKASVKNSQRHNELKDHEIELACASPSAITLYLCYGKRSLGKSKADLAGLPKSAMHWAPISGDLVRPDPGATVSMLAGFYWSRVSSVLASIGRPISLPNEKLLCDAIGELRTRLTAKDLIRRAVLLTEHWSAVLEATKWRTTPVLLNEKTLLNESLVEIAMRLESGHEVERPSWRRDRDEIGEMVAAIEADLGV